MNVSCQKIARLALIRIQRNKGRRKPVKKLRGRHRSTLGCRGDREREEGERSRRRDV